MPRLALALAASLALASCAHRGAAAPPPGPADRALEALGGADALARLRTVVLRGKASFWEPEQSLRAGGESRFAGEATFVATRDLETGAARVEWTRRLVYPSRREYRFTELVTPAAGAVLGIDTAARTRQSLASDPPRHAMSGVRLAAALRELARTSPRLLADLARAGATPVEGATLGGLPAQALRGEAGGAAFTVILDPRSGLPARVRTVDDDAILGDVEYDLVLEDWRDVAGVKLAHRLRYELGGKEVVRVEYDEVRPDAAIAAGALELPADLRAAAPGPARAGVPFQWVLRRQHIGTYLDSDAVLFDAGASGGLRLAELAAGVVQVVGGSHNSLAVELADGLVVFDAPVSEAQSKVTLDLLRARFPGKPVRTLVLSHHHMDHAGGARTYVAEGAVVIVGAGNRDHFARVFAAPHRVLPDALARGPRPAEIVEVDDRRVLTDGARSVEILAIENPHALGMLIGYVPEARLGFVADLWSPGRDELGAALTPGQAALVKAVRRAGLEPLRFAGGHGTVADWAPLEALAPPRDATSSAGRCRN